MSNITARTVSRMSHLGLLRGSREHVKGHRFRVTVIGSGNWGTTIAKIVSENTGENPEIFRREVRMWVFEEILEGRKLTEIINQDHENVKYLPGIKLPTNLVAVPDLLEAVTGSNILIFNIPHQFLKNVCKQLEGKVPPHARAISCLKGLDVSSEGVFLLSDFIERSLNIHCGALSGANLAPEIARGMFSETTIAYRHPEDFFDGDVDKHVLHTLFHRHYFHVHVIEDVAGVSLAGALKNIIALSAGMIDGKEWGSNAKAAIMRRGLLEMVHFAGIFFPDCNVSTFTEESAGVADLITSCAGGRNHRIGMEMARTGKPLKQLEEEMLNGQSAQGIITALEVHELLEAKGLLEEFPLFEATYQIAHCGIELETLPKILEQSDPLL